MGFDLKLQYVLVLIFGFVCFMVVGFLGFVACEFVGSMAKVKYFFHLASIFPKNYTLYAHKMHKGGQIWFCAQLFYSNT